MPRTLEMHSIDNNDDEITVVGGKLAWSEVDDWDSTDLLPLEGEQPRGVIDEITDSHDFSEIIARFEAIVTEQGLNIEPGGALQVWEDVLARLGPLSPEQEIMSHQIVLSELEDVHKNLDQAAFTTLFPVSKAVELLDGKDREIAIKTFTEVLDTVKTPVIATDSNGNLKRVDRIDPSLVQASEEILDEIAENPEHAADFESELKRRAIDVSIESLNKAIKRKQRKELFKNVATGKILKEMFARRSAKNPDEHYEEMISVEQQIRTDTNAFEVIELPEPRPKMTLEELEAEADEHTDPEQMSAIDDFIEQQMKMASTR